MTDKPVYWDKPSYRIMAKQLDDLLGKEKQLQAIKDAWDRFNTPDDFTFGKEELFDTLKSVLSGALIEEDNDEML